MHNRVKPKRTRNIKLLAFGCACLTQGLFLFGFKVASIPIGNWASRANLIWIIDSNPKAINLQATAVPLSVMDFEEEPDLLDQMFLKKYSLAGLSPAANPIIFLNNDDDKSMISAKSFHSILPNAKKVWKISGLQKLGRNFVNEWRKLSMLPKEQIEIPTQPVTLSVELSELLGSKSIIVLASSGSEQFDQEVVNLLLSLPLKYSHSPDPEVVSMPQLKRAIINVSLEEEKRL